MLGDAKTFSDDADERRSQSFHAPGEWTTPSSAAGLGPTIAPSWDTAWMADTAAPIEPESWATAELVADSAAETEPRGFAGWGGLASTDPDPVSHEESAWDSPSDAVVAEVTDAPWGFQPITEAPVPAVEPDVPATPAAWAELPDPPSSSAAAWDPAPPPPNESEVSVADRSDEGPAGVLTPKRRGRLAARSANRSVAPVAVEPEPPTPVEATHDDVPGDATTAEISQPSSFEPGLQPDDTPPDEVVSSPDTELGPDTASPPDAASLADTASPADTELALSVEPLDVERVVAAGASSGPGRRFFAKRNPEASALSSNETPKVLRIAAVVSLLVGLGLFGYSVVAGRSSDPKPTVVTTPPTPTLPIAPVAEATVAASPTTDPIFGSNETVGSPLDLAGATVAVDPIFGAADTTGPQTVTTLTTGATVIVDPVFGSNEPASASDPLFGSSPPVAAKVAGVTVTADDELVFDSPAKTSR